MSANTTLNISIAYYPIIIMLRVPWDIPVPLRVLISTETTKNSFMNRDRSLIQLLILCPLEKNKEINLK